MTTTDLRMVASIALPPTGRRPLRRALALTRHAGVRCLGIYLVLAVFADYPLWPGNPNQLPTEVGGDIVQTAWFLEWTPYALLHGLNPFFTNFINYPRGVDIAQNTGIQLLALVTAPLTLLVSPVASENLLRFVAFPLSAYAAYWVLRHWTRFAPAAFVGGLLYGFSPYMVTQGEYHLNLIFVPFPPLIIYALYQLLVVQKGRPTRWGLLLGVFCVGQFYVSSEVLATTALVCGVGIFFLVFLNIRQFPQRFPHALFGLAIAGAFILPLIAYPVWELLRGAEHYNGPAQGFNNVYNADLAGSILPTRDMLFAPARLSGPGMKLVQGQVQENGSYLGIPLVALTTYLCCRYWRKLWFGFAALMALSAFVLSLGPRLIADGRVIHLPFHLPFAKIARLPVVENILPVRLSLYTVFFVAVILALAIDSYHDELAARAPRSTPRRSAFSAGRLAMAGVIALCGLTLLPRWPYRTFGVNVGVHYSETPAGLSTIPAGSTVLAYPYPTSFFDMAMLWQSLDHMNFRLLGSYALVPNAKGAATIFPSILQPKNVEAMLVNSVTTVDDPNLPDLVATATTIAARRIILIPPGEPCASGLHATLVGRVGSVDLQKHRFYLYKNHYVPTAVTWNAATTFVDPRHLQPYLTLHREVAVIGTTGPGTVTPVMIAGLRTYLRNNHVTAVILGLGITDAAEMANWFRAAIGLPTRSGGGAMLWNNVAAVLRQPPPTAPRPVVASALR